MSESRIIGFVGPEHAAMYYPDGQWILDRLTGEQYWLGDDGVKVPEKEWIAVGRAA